MIRPPKGRLAVLSVGLVLLVCAAIAANLVWRSHRVPQTLRAGIRNHSLTTVNPEGRVDALAVEVLAAAARRSGIRLKWIECPEGPDAALRAHKIDVWPIAQDLPERHSRFHITQPWLAAERSLITEGPPPKNWKNLTVAYGLGPERQLLQAAPGAKPTHAEGDVAAVTAVCAGTAKAAYILTQSLGAFVLRKPPGCETVDFRVTPVAGKPLKLGIASTFEAAGQADKLRISVGRMAAQGKLEELFEKYSLYSIAETADIYELMATRTRAHVLEFGAAGLIVVLGSLLWQVRRTREARRAAEHANSAKSQFLANMSHEIRTPLNGIVGMAEVLDRSALSGEQRGLLGVILTSSRQLMTIVNDILDFSKIEAGGMSIEETVFKVRDLVDDVIRLFQPRAEEKGLKIECRTTGDLPHAVVGDPTRVRQILMNLLSNAIKFTETGRICVDVARAGSGNGSSLLFRVTDSGVGIAPEISAKLFRAFTQADSSTTRKFGGTGLGLAISLRLVTLMGGSIGLESEPGKGSIFWFIIPAPPASLEESEPAQPGVPLLASDVAPTIALNSTPVMSSAASPATPAILRTPVSTELPPQEAANRAILIVEDNPVNQLVAERALSTLGYTPTIVSSGEAALETIADRDFDLILMDCQMPGMDGYETTTEIRRREVGLRHTTIVAMTANSIEGDRERCMQAGMDDYLSKPFRINVLDQILRRWINGENSPMCSPGTERRPVNTLAFGDSTLMRSL
ncbi:MAG TPA: ATP-binding protein [Bryobacteraceae bacterium]|nr:ATP-binding protein [Bryobacteraceae bacterium]